MTRPIDQIKEMLAVPDAKLFTPILPGHASVYVLAADRESAVGALHEINLAIRERRLVLDELVSVHQAVIAAAGVKPCQKPSKLQEEINAVAASIHAKVKP